MWDTTKYLFSSPNERLVRKAVKTNGNMLHWASDLSRYLGACCG
jgi:hypothetical protein